MGNRRRSLIVLGLVIVLVAVSVWAIFENPTRQGLDLKGGTELVYEGRGTPANPNPEPEDIDRSVDIIRERVDTLGVAEPEISRIGETQVSVGLPEVQNAEQAAEQVGQTSQLAFYDFERNVIPPDADVQNAEERTHNRLFDAVDAAQERKRECAEKDGEKLCTTNGPSYYLFDENTLEYRAGPEAQRSDLFTLEEERPPGTIIESVPQGTVVLQAEPLPDNPDTDVNESDTAPRGWYVLQDRPEVTGEDIRNPEQQLDQITNSPNVTFDFTDEGRLAFKDVTQRIAQRGAEKPEALAPGLTIEQAANISDSFAVVLDGEIVSRPIINFRENPAGIDGRTGAQISGNFTVQQAQDLAEFLRIGALPVNLVLISQSTVSATLGQEALNSALLAGGAGIVLVLLFLLAYYRFLGLVAALGLFVYALFYLAMIKTIPITMTLPGIAGLILTIGVAADSNIIIFERIKEEARHGRSMLSAISQGYRKGIATIIDANVITLITAFILFVLASAGVKGFALTLGIGTLVSLFTAVLFTQAVLAVLGRARFLRSPRFLGAGEPKFSTDFNFTGMSKYFFMASGVILAIGSIAFATKQLNLGIDFESGTRISVGLEQEADSDEIRAAIADAGIGAADSAEIQAVENEQLGANAFQINADFTPTESTEVGTALDDEFGRTEFDSTSIGPTFGEQIARSALIALLFSLIVISVYVAIRFEAKYAVPILIALVHDILLAGGAYALMGFEVNSATVAAFLTILGYSIYDCVIVFDRVRENVPRMPRAAFSQIVNRSMSEVLVRSLITGLSTVFLLAMILVFGDETLRGFAIAMMIGIASGTYSSIFIAAPVLTEWKEREPAYRSRRSSIQEAMGYVPVFPEQNVVARLGEQEADGEAEPQLAAGAPQAVADGAEEPVEPASLAPSRADDDEAAAKRERRKQRKQRRQQRRRKHGKHR